MTLPSCHPSAGHKICFRGFNVDPISSHLEAFHGANAARDEQLGGV
jgi:hypothetical protein